MMWWSHHGVAAWGRLGQERSGRAQGALKVGAEIGVGSKYRRGEGRRGETSPNSLPSNPPVCPSAVSSRARVFCRWGRGALLGAVQVPRVCLPTPGIRPLLSCAWRNGPRRSLPPPALLHRWTGQLSSLVLALEVQVPSFHRMQEGEKERKQARSCG